MKNLTRIAAAVAALAVAAPALPCGLMQHEAASATPQPVVAGTARPEAKAEPQKAAPKQAQPEKKLAKTERPSTVAKN